MGSTTTSRGGTCKEFEESTVGVGITDANFRVAVVIDGGGTFKKPFAVSFPLEAEKGSISQMILPTHTGVGDGI